MRYCLSFYLNQHRNQEGSKLKATYLLDKKLTFNFNHSQFLCQLRQKFIHYLILKLHSLPRWRSVGWSVLALIGSKIATTFQSSEFHFGIDWSFKMSYCMNFYLNWHRNCERSEFELSNLLNKKHIFNFNPFQFLCQLRQRFIQYFILKLQSMAKWVAKG